MSKSENARRASALRASAAMTLALGVGSVLALAPPAFAQGAVDTIQDEIIITATKRGEAMVQNVPLAVTAFSSDQLEALNFQDLQSLSYSMPNVQLEDIGTARNVANFAIRGIGINSSIPSVDPTVGVFVDGVYLGINAGVLADNFDLEAIEVLRGPQGTLYGRNVTGGAVLVRTRAPTDELEISGRVGVETGLQYTADASISGPLAEGVLSGKLAIYHSRDEGWFENDLDGSQFGESDLTIYRAALRLTPTPQFEAILRLEQGYGSGDGPASQNHALFGRNTHNFSINNRGYGTGDWEQATLELNWDVGFGDGTITNITGWRDYDSATSGDIDATGTNAAVLGGGTSFHSRSVTEQDQFSNELRYAGTFGPVDITTGIYNFSQNLFYIEERFLLAAAGPVHITRVGGGSGDFSTFGAFASADWHLSEQVTLNFGLRYTEENKDAQVSRIRRAGDNLDGALVLVPGEGVIGGSIDNRTLNFSDSPFELSWTDTSPRIGVQWEPNDDTNLYAFWAKGFRSGGVNFRTTTVNPPGTSGAPRAFDSEQQSSFEVGWKQDFWDNRGRLNLAVFHNTIEDMQRETNFPEPGTVVQQQIVNAGEAVIQGAELEFRFVVTENFLVSGQVGYTNGEYETVTADLTGDGLINAADLSREIPRLAPWTYGINFVYDLPIAGGVLSNRLGYNHRDPAFYNDANTGRLAEVDVVDVNLTYRPDDAGWSLSVYGKNLTNDVSWGGDTTLPSSPAFAFSGGSLATFSPLNEGRVIGAELRVDFH